LSLTISVVWFRVFDMLINLSSSKVSEKATSYVN
jgi:hypothetical protein